MLCVAVFAVTAAGLYSHFWQETQNRWGVERPKSTAIVRIQSLAPGPDGDPRPRIAPPDRQALRQELTSDSTLGEVSSALRALPTHIASLRENLEVEVTESETPREIRVAISCSDANPKLACDVVNLLSQRYADGCRSRVRSEMEQVCTAARDAATRARTERAAAKTTLEEFLASFFRQVEASTNVKPDSGDSQKNTGDSKPTIMVENPRWIEVKRELAQLQERRTELLVTKTPLHPEIQRQDEKIAEVKTRFAAIPQQIAQTDTAKRVVAPSATSSAKPSPQSQESREVVQTHERLRSALERAEANVERLALAERTAWEARTRLPRVELVPAESTIGLPPTGVGTGLFWIIMAAASAMSIGIGLAAMGIVADPPLATLSEIQRSLSVPIACVFHSTNLPDEPVAKQGAPRSRFPWIASGSMLIVGAIAITIAIW